MMKKNPRYCCVAFDAVGTLIHAEPPVARAYLEIGRKHGAALTLDEVHHRFCQVMRERQVELRTDEQREREFWREIVSRVIGPVDDPEACFEELHAHFGRAEAWRSDSEAARTMDALAAAGVTIAVASNFDARLHHVLDGIPELASIRIRVISSEVGWRKPSPEFYRALLAAAGCSREELLIVGDDFENDVHAPRGAGFDALHFRPRTTSSSDTDAICSLTEVLVRCGLMT